MANALRDLWRPFLALAVTALATFMLICGPIELSLVNRVQSWPTTQIRLGAITDMAGSSNPYRAYPSLAATDLETGKQIEIHDAQPGDIPWSATILFWRVLDQRRDLLAAAGQPGSVVTAYRAPDGSRYFLWRGSPRLMEVLLALSAAWWLFILNRWRQRRRASPRVV